MQAPQPTHTGHSKDNARAGEFKEGAKCKNGEAEPQYPTRPLALMVAAVNGTSNGRGKSAGNDSLSTGGTNSRVAALVFPEALALVVERQG